MKVTNKNRQIIHNKIYELGLKGYFPMEIAKILGVSDWLTRKIFKERSLKLQGSGAKSKSVTDDFLQKKSDKNYYFIGYLAADGYISKNNNVSISSIDVDHLSNFGSIYEQNFSFYYYTNEAGNLYCQLNFCNKKVATFLRNNFNLYPNKSKTLKLPELNWSILRGVFDGDGSCKKEIKITTGSALFKDQLLEFFHSNNILAKYRIKGKNKDCYDVVIPAKFHSLFAYNLYKDAAIFMNRKYIEMCALLSKDNMEKWDKLREA